jgi:DeoR/GlpR family transcriptional regulator of sugar metabolism
MSGGFVSRSSALGDASTKREEAILSAVREGGRITVTELSDRLAVSAVTIRKDLASLESRGLLLRVHGGAVAPVGTDEGPFGARLHINAATKQAIGRAAAPLVRDGDSIAIDSSTTAYHLAYHLLDRDALVVVTYSLRLATLLMEQSNATVIMPGGVLRRASGALVGGRDDFLEGRGQLARGFFGATGVSRTLGLLELAPDEADAKRNLVASCREVVALCTPDKFNGVGLHSFVPPERISTIVTGTGAASEVVSAWRALGVSVHAPS